MAVVLYIAGIVEREKKEVDRISSSKHVQAGKARTGSDFHRIRQIRVWYIERTLTMEDVAAKLPNTSLAQDNVYSSSSNLSTLEAEVLGEYARLAKNLDQVCPASLARLN